MICKYIKPGKLRNRLILFDRDTILIGGIDGDATPPSFILPEDEPEILETIGTEYSETESLDERYMFERTVTVKLDGYRLFDNTSFVLGIETEDGTVFLVNPDLKYDVSSEYKLNNDGSLTTLSFHVLSNMPLVGNSSATYKTETCPAYQQKVKPESIKVKLHGTCFIDDYGQLITTDGDEFAELAGATGIELSENTDDDGNITRSITFKLPFAYQENGDIWNMLELPSNKWNAIVTDSTGFEWYLGFHQHGMECSYTVEENSFNVTFSERCTVPLSVGQYSGTTSTYTFWRYSHEFERCVGNGFGVPMLQAEIDVSGRETGYYKCLSDYLDYFVHLGYNIVDTFDSAPLIKSDSCDEGPCRCQTDRKVIEFNEYIDTVSMTIMTDCAWSLAGLPSWLEANPDYGTGSTDIEFVCTETASTRTTIYLNVDGGENISLDVINDMGGVLATSYQVDARSQTLRVQMDHFTVSSSDIPYSTTSDGIIFSIPENTTTSARTFTSAVVYSNNNVTITIEQAGRYEKWVATTGFICQSGNTYSRQELLISYDNINWHSEGIYRPYGLVAEGQDLCSGYMERWQDVGGFLCYNEKQYHSETLQVSTDGGQTWSDTSEIRIGQINNITAIQHSARCSNLDYEWRLTDLTICKQ